MSKLLWVTFLGMFGACLASHIEDPHGLHEKESKKDYNFDYSVHDPHTHDYHSHQESSKDGVVKGYYSVKDADGSLREVHYTADPKIGFKAIVTKNGVQVHPHAQGSANEHRTEHHGLEEHHVSEHLPGHNQLSEHHGLSEHHHIEEHHLPEHHLPEHHHFPEQQHHLPEHHFPDHHEHPKLPEHPVVESGHHLSDHHEHSFAVGLSSLHDHGHHFSHQHIGSEHLLHHF